MDIPHFVHPLADGHLGCVHLWVIVNSDAMNIFVRLFCLKSCLQLFVYLPRSGISGSFDNFLTDLGATFSFLRETSGFTFSGLPRVCGIRKGC